ncbi:MAG: hypothetical protein RLO50_17610 [Azospirillaceae bacterium]
MLGRRLAFRGPARLIHGRADRDVPWQLSRRLAAALGRAQVRLDLVADGDHRLSRPQDLARMLAAVESVALMVVEQGVGAARGRPGPSGTAP